MGPKEFTYYERRKSKINFCANTHTYVRISVCVRMCFRRWKQYVDLNEGSNTKTFFRSG